MLNTILSNLQVQMPKHSSSKPTIWTLEKITAHAHFMQEKEQAQCSLESHSLIKTLTTGIPQIQQVPDPMKP